ncbi:MAG: sigma-70 family RNA polymerase sigma factor [Acidimicrobiales bacterium]|nr:sigma-70 family RNA polymerase sigma factor [Acidimicrobiales bacterium]
MIAIASTLRVAWSSAHAERPLLESTAFLSVGANLDRVSIPHSDEKALAARAATDFDAFAQLYRIYLPRIHAFVLRRTGDVDTTEDICSATFESALRSIDSFRWRSGGFGPWIFRIANRQLITHYRRTARPRSERGQRAMGLMSDAEVPAVSLDGLSEAERVRAAMSRLNSRYQQALSLRYFADLDTSQAAQAMGVPKATFSVVLNRASNALRKELERGDRDG